MSGPEDADLLAAAPDLLAACEAMLQLVRDFAAYYEIPDNHPDADLIKSHAMAAHAAIRKAKGGVS